METTTVEMVMNASPASCFLVASDVERYPEWLPEVRHVVVLDRDEQSRPCAVAFEVGAFGRNANYILVYDFADAPRSFRWSQREGDITYALDGSYRFDEHGEGATTVHYELSVGLRVPIPGFVRRRAETLIVDAALRDLKRRVEHLGE